MSKSTPVSPAVAPGPCKERTITLKIKVPSFSTPEQAMQSAARIKSMLQTSLHSQVEVELWAKNAQRVYGWCEVGEVHWEVIE